MELLQNGVATYFQSIPLISMRTESQASSQSCSSGDADAWCKQALRSTSSRITYGNLADKFEQNWRVAEMVRDMPVI